MLKTTVSVTAPRDTLDPVSVLVDERKIRLNKESLFIRAVDPVNVGMVDLAFDAAAPESYKTHSGVIDVNPSRLEEVAGMVGAGDPIHLTLDEETRKPSIRIDGLSYTLTFIDPDSTHQEPDTPDLDLAANIAPEETYLDRGIKAADMTSDHIHLRIDGAEETFHIEAEGGTDDVDLSLPPADLISIGTGVTDLLLSLDYPEDMNRVIPASAEITVELGEELPVKLHYQIAEGMGTITYVLAPHIQSN